ncbi:MAG: type II secretion system protein GspE [Bdellovibrio sp. CG12_big_fil_rev_8_21_14_0_65_39_13]|nr:MAG: type II secretion system protein GspE [Bdellovibrio sp. CG22_combo_CG10-13_8_21_14_all_39_27]PIQ61454.1 MAG: type II secretion system protein GspE [Bdellovibrio sp. CG12_big_fil_rev_8_21_14_0_65_39_13]PIR35300.1 MAG: type II secretion system protein GspE [Bdellovibrio sp. CG11_big_fil_rev_8_21_14_0_20_39_38]
MKISEGLLKKMEAPSNKIGELLLAHTNLTEGQLNEALQIQEDSGRLIGEILLAKNYITPHDIVKVLCHQFEIPFMADLKIDDIDPNITHPVPINYAKQNELIPILETEVSLTVAMTDPFNFDAINDLQELYKKEVKLVVAPAMKIQEAINRIYEKATSNIVGSLEDEFEEGLDLEGPIDILDAGADEAPVIRFVNSIIFRAVKEGASDIHIEPYDRESVYRFRINGVMSEILRQPIKAHAAVTARIKVMAKLDIAEKRMPQDGRIKIKIAGKDVDIRLSTVPVQTGERVVMRVLEKSNRVLQLEHLGFHGKTLRELDEMSKRKHGVIYVSGPTGSGKTTTLFGMLDRIKTPDKMIITVEDPVEYEISGVSQIQVNHKIDLSFARALRSIVRQDPDVIMVGETRDLETAQMAIEASLTGHFVLSTIHTNDAASCPNRLIDMGVQPFLIASSLIAVLAQRLIQTLCNDCKKPHNITPEELKVIGLTRLPSDATIFKSEGCPKCNWRGYASRTTVAELLLITDDIRMLVMQKADAATVKKKAIEQGMSTLRQDTIYKVLRGITSIDEMVRVINEEEEG